LHEAAPKDLAPNLYKIARFKSRLICTELQNYKWISNLANITSTQEMEEFTMLFMALAPVSLNSNPDTIKWRWTSNGQYSVASAYKCQFTGAIQKFPSRQVWKAQTDPRSKFFVWLVLHNRVLTADNMLKKNWPCDETYCFCLSMFEMTNHLLLHCNYTEVVWNIVATSYSLPNYAALSHSVGPAGWLRKIAASGDGRQKKNTGILCTFWWMVWKERNRRIFDQLELSPNSLARFIQESISAQQLAWESAAN
jgi:hypothetical protein